MMSEADIRDAVHNCVSHNHCENCQYAEQQIVGDKMYKLSTLSCKRNLLNDVDRLLLSDTVEREAHIIGFEAFLYGNCNPFKNGCVWIEIFPHGLAPAFFDCTHGHDVRFLSLYLTETNSHTMWMSGEYYGKTWRCWSARPTDRQREETKWLPID